MPIFFETSPHYWVSGISIVYIEVNMEMLRMPFKALVMIHNPLGQSNDDTRRKISKSTKSILQDFYHYFYYYLSSLKIFLAF